MPHARYETNGDVGEIVLSNPPLNLFDATLMAELRTAALTSHLFETQDSRNAVQSFLQNGPGHATFTGK